MIKMMGSNVNSLVKLDEVSHITGIKPYVLRFWESEFSQIDPIISSAGQKLFSRKDIDFILDLKKVLFEDKLTIEKAKYHFDKMAREPEETEIVEAVEIKPPVNVQEKVKETNNIKSPRPRLSQRKQILDEEGIDSPLFHFGDLEVQKLVLAKAKLNKIISNINSLESRNHW
jgi:DNA-binding transcriptional MerR regulator